jgi:protein involved in polysaccharide export with SLBB domain
MNRSSGIVFLPLALVALLIAAPLAAWCDGSKLVVGDVISVAVDGEKELSKPYQINSDGCVAVSMIGAVKVTGLNTSDASAAITKALDKILVNPQVTVQFIERAKMQVFVVGQVLKRGLVDIGVGDKVIQALAQAGYDDTADLSHVNIRRGDEIMDVDLTKYLTGQDLTVNKELASGDTVVVPRVDMVGSVMVLGQVSKVGSVPLKRDTSFREVMGLIGDVNVDADTEKISIKREGVAEPILVNYKAAMTGDPTADIKVHPGDTIFVPQMEGAFFTVIGGVNRPGQYPLKDKLMLSQAIGVAGGGIVNVGDLRKVQIMRGSGKGPKLSEATTVDLTQVLKGTIQEPMIRRGDVIYVTEHKQHTSIMQMLQSVLPFGWLLKRP